jgi:hypothetical protein
MEQMENRWTNFNKILYYSVLKIVSVYFKFCQNWTKQRDPYVDPYVHVLCVSSVNLLNTHHKENDFEQNSKED